MLSGYRVSGTVDIWAKVRLYSTKRADGRPTQTIPFRPTCFVVSYVCNQQGRRSIRARGARPPPIFEVGGPDYIVGPPINVPESPTLGKGLTVLTHEIGTKASTLQN